VTADNDEAMFVQWTRVGDDLSGSITFARLGAPVSTERNFLGGPAQPDLLNELARDVDTEKVAFTGTVAGDSVRLQQGSGALATRYNGRIDGDALKLTLPSPGGDVSDVRLSEASRSDFDGEVRRIRAAEKRRADTTRQRRMKADREALAEIATVATAFQRALGPDSSDDPCKYMTSAVRQGLVEGSGRDLAGTSCRVIARENAVGSVAPRGTPKITLREYIRNGLDDEAHNGAQVRWPALNSSHLYVELAKNDGQWRVVNYSS